MNEMLKEFLVGLGFAVDDASLKKFNSAVISATKRIAALYASIKVMSAAIVFGISKISEGFEQMGYEFRLIAPAINKTLILRREMLKAYSSAGINIRSVVKDSIRLNMSLTKTKYALEAIYKSVASRFFNYIAIQSDTFRKKLYENMPKIQSVIEKMVKFVFKALEATLILGQRVWSILTRLYDFFYRLHQATDGWSSIILGLIAVWKLLNLSFLATPLGMLLAGFLALLALYDDFMTWKEGGESLIDWGSKATRMVVGMIASVGALVVALKVLPIVFGAVSTAIATFKGALVAARAAFIAFSLVAHLNPLSMFLIAVTALIGLLSALIIKWDAVKKMFSDLSVFKSIGDIFGSIGDKVLDFVGGNALTTPTVLGGNTQNQTTQNVQQQTNINITGTADASAVGRMVTTEQSRVNFDLVRNLRSGAR